MVVFFLCVSCNLDSTREEVLRKELQCVYALYSHLNLNTIGAQLAGLMYLKGYSHIETHCIILQSFNQNLWIWCSFASKVDVYILFVRVMTPSSWSDVHPEIRSLSVVAIVYTTDITYASSGDLLQSAGTWKVLGHPFCFYLFAGTTMLRRCWFWKGKRVGGGMHS